MEASNPPAELLTFEAPPVNEVYLSVQFQQSVGDEAFVLADFWPQVRAEFPTLDRQPQLPRVEERFDLSAQPPQIPFQFTVGTPPQRYWFVSVDSTRLLQVQPDRFFFNWRRVNDGNTYPRYHTLRPEFARHFASFLGALPGDRRSAAVVDWCDICYINHVAAQSLEDPRRHMPLTEILRFIDEPDAGTLRPVEDMQVQMRSVLRGEDNVPNGRIYVTATPGYRAADRMPIYVIELLVRGRPAGLTPDEILAFADRGREQIVTTFRDITTPEMHEHWRLRNGG